jgi:hypothetical protein
MRIDYDLDHSIASLISLSFYLTILLDIPKISIAARKIDRKRLSYDSGSGGCILRVGYDLVHTFSSLKFSNISFKSSRNKYCTKKNTREEEV